MLREKGKFASDTIITMVQYVRFMERILLDSVNDVNAIDEMFAMIDALIEKLNRPLYAKFCMGCRENSSAYQGYQGIHELCDIVSFAVKLFENGIRHRIISEKHVEKISTLFELKIEKMVALKCNGRIQQKKQAAIELLQLQRLCSDVDELKIDLSKLRDVEFLESIYSETEQFIGRNKILIQILCCYEEATADRIEQRCIEFIDRNSEHLDDFQTPVEYFRGQTVKPPKLPDVIEMTTVLHRCAVQWKTVPVRFLNRLIEQLLDEPSHCKCKRLQFLLAQPFNQIDAWLEHEEIENFATGNCVGHSKNINEQNAVTLLRLAIDIFKISKTLQQLKCRNNENSLIGCTFERLKNENTLIATLRNAGKKIDEMLLSVTDKKHKMTLNEVQMAFCFRSIHFIKGRLTLFNGTSSYIFTSLHKLIEMPLRGILRMNLLIILAKFSNEYTEEENDKIMMELDNIIGSNCEHPNTDDSEATIQNVPIYFALMLRRRTENGTENGRANDLLSPILGTPYFQTVDLMYLGTKSAPISGDDLDKNSKYHETICSYIKSIELADDDLYRNRNKSKMMTAAVQFIFAVDAHNLSDAGRTTFNELIDHILNICKDFGLNYQIANLYLLQGSFQLNAPERLKVHAFLEFFKC